MTPDGWVPVATLTDGARTSALQWATPQRPVRVKPHPRGLLVNECARDCARPPGHLDAFPCGEALHVPGSPCRFCEEPTPQEGGPCEVCWTRVPDNLADAKALFARGDLSLDLVKPCGEVPCPELSP